MDNLYDSSKPLRSLFYAVSYNESSFKTIEEVPNYITEAIPMFTMLIFVEQIILWIQGKSVMRINDTIGSLSAGMLQEMWKTLIVAMEFVVYIWVFENFHIVELDWNSVWTWWLTLLGVDFAYYWLHRMSHEINIMWGAHQVHHSSEDYNLGTALRQSVFQQYFATTFYLPMAFFVPPSVFLVHLQLNTLFQFYIHTCIVGKLGFLDYIINTPSNHRVHHGRNRYCIDKNYAAVFMFWDHMFGTYQAEEDEVVFGLVHPLSSFEPIYVQLCHYIYMWKTFWSMEGIGNKLSVIFKGPGWTPGQPRLGNIEDIPDISAPMPKYHPAQATWKSVYLFSHFLFVVFIYQQFALHHGMLCITMTLLLATFIIFTLVTFGAILDQLCFAPVLEALRCAFTVAGQHIFLNPLLSPLGLPSIVTQSILLIHLVSAFIWIIECKSLIKPVMNAVKQD